MNLTEPFETARLRFRLLKPGDLTAVYRQFSDPDMCRYLSDPPCTQNEAQEIIEHYSKPEGKGYLRYGMFNKSTSDFIGTYGYHYWDSEKNQVELGYDVWKNYWGMGYMSEAMPELINLCFNSLGAQLLYVLIHPDNKPSIALAQKFGFKPCEFCREPDSQPLICMSLQKHDSFNIPEGTI